MNHRNLHVIQSANIIDIIEGLEAVNIWSGVFTNGIYGPPKTVVLPTTLAGFRYATDKHGKPDDAVIVAVNSDISMSGINAKRNATPDQIAQTQGQYERAAKIAEPLAMLFPERPVAIIFYDDETPERLYATLAESGFGMRALFKWGFGTNPEAPRIEGASHFQNVIAHPFLNDDKAICHDITVVEDQSRFVEVVKLQETGPYMSPEGKLLFALPPILASYGAGNGYGGVAPQGPSMS